VPLVFIEVIEQRSDLRMLQLITTEQLLNRAPVFLLHIGIIVLVVGTGARELDGVRALAVMSQSA
jgi:hypothetical protein